MNVSKDTILNVSMTPIFSSKDLNRSFTHSFTQLINLLSLSQHRLVTR